MRMSRWPAGLALVLASVVCAAAGSAAAAPASPVLGVSAVVHRIGGRVTVERPGSRRFVKLGATATTIPFGSTISTAAGTVQVTIASPGGAAPVSALFYSGQFAITQDTTTGVATLTLNGPLVACPASGATGASAATKSLRAAGRKPKARPAKPTQRSLWGNGGAGHFQTKGNYAAATVLGTVWLTTDSCTATQVGVAEGSVSVTNLVTSTSQTVTTNQAFNVASSGTTSTTSFAGPTTPPNWNRVLNIRSSSTSVKLGSPYTLTATGNALGPGSGYIYENVGSPCSTTLAAEQVNSVAFLFTSKTFTTAGPFTLTAPAVAQHTGTKYYCAYLTNPAVYAQVVVTVKA
jgi:hypothetical protein